MHLRNRAKGTFIIDTAMAPLPAAFYRARLRYAVLKPPEILDQGAVPNMDDWRPRLI